jgi:hypothetical protein
MTETRENLVRVVKTSALVIVPLLCGLIFFLVEAPGRGTGVYLEVERGADTVVHEVAGFPSRVVASPAGAAAHALVIPDGQLLSFFIVGPPASAIIQAAPAAKLYAFVIDDSDPKFVSDYALLPATVRQVNPRAYRVTSDQFLWNADSLAYKQYQKVLATSLGSRATMEAMVGVEVSDPNGGATMYAVRVGPPR